MWVWGCGSCAHDSQHQSLSYERKPQALTTTCPCLGAYCVALLQMSPAPEGFEGGSGAATPDGFYQVYRGPERAYVAKRLVPGVQYCGRVKAINCEVGRHVNRRQGG